jgi:hypothetical protein
MAGLSEDLIVGLCSKPCRGRPTTTSQHRLLPSGEVEVTGEPPPALCDGCPERGADGPPLHLAFLFGFPPTADLWEVAGIESGAGTAIVEVIVDD